MKLHELTPAADSNRPVKRIGRGHGSGNGKTAGKGHKGQNARSGGGVKILGNGELNVKLTVQAAKFSASAAEKIEKAGGKAEVM